MLVQEGANIAVVAPEPADVVDDVQSSPTKKRRPKKKSKNQAKDQNEGNSDDEATLTAAVAVAAAAKRAMLAAGLTQVPALQAALRNVDLRCPDGHALRCAAVWHPGVRCTRCATELAGAAAAGCDVCPAGDQVVFCAACVGLYKGGAEADKKG